MAAFVRKIEVIERYGRDGFPMGVDEKSVPRDRAKLRRWKDASRRLWSWVDPNVDSPKGRNVPLYERFQQALNAIESRRVRRGANLMGELKAKDQIIASLERQNARLLDQIVELQKRIRVAPMIRK